MIAIHSRRQPSPMSLGHWGHTGDLDTSSGWSTDSYQVVEVFPLIGLGLGWKTGPRALLLPQSFLVLFILPAPTLTPSCPLPAPLGTGVKVAAAPGCAVG